MKIKGGGDGWGEGEGGGRREKGAVDNECSKERLRELLSFVVDILLVGLVSPRSSHAVCPGAGEERLARPVLLRAHSGEGRPKKCCLRTAYHRPESANRCFVSLYSVGLGRPCFAARVLVSTGSPSYIPLQFKLLCRCSSTTNGLSASVHRVVRYPGNGLCNVKTVDRDTGDGVISALCRDHLCRPPSPRNREGATSLTSKSPQTRTSGKQRF